MRSLSSPLTLTIRSLGQTFALSYIGNPVGQHTDLAILGRSNDYYRLSKLPPSTSSYFTSKSRENT
ncbi:hypothetical protein CROQUDRAFT_659248 [Cronartium quercuum f. sp. fusiforme G11]|uniref:Uncharacterized protein n=1 Tax=Cronartium quercuum f. sp. fusiforme G11 TaxID=708437 RepID=A0A9P6NIW7_9BASI|nr:hypothetical protein CROQUDRAFT_659248 [Cronartium quercuum f. sp. fusiforme G11]